MWARPMLNAVGQALSPLPLIALVTTLDVALRNTLSVAIPGVYEFSGYIFAIATTWGFSFVLFERAHVRIDAAYQ